MTARSSDHFRHVLGHVPTGITVVAGLDGDQPIGLAIGSFFSVSLDPQLVGFCVGRTSRSWPRIEPSGSFCINVLANDQATISQIFASGRGDKFADISWRQAGSGSPLLDGALAWIDCDLSAIHDAGDHRLVVGSVRDLDVLRDAGPLVFFRGKYRRLDEDGGQALGRAPAASDPGFTRGSHV